MSSILPPDRRSATSPFSDLTRWFGAIEAANNAWPAWRRLPAHERSALLRRWAGLITANQEDLALLMTLECGKPLSESRNEVVYSASFIEWFAEEGKRIDGDVIPSHQADRRIVVLKQAGGRVGGHHAVELPGGDDRAQGRPGPRRGMHDGGQAGPADAVLGAGDGGAGRARRHPCWRLQRRHRRRTASIGRALPRSPAGSQAVVHWLDRRRQAVAGAVRRER